MTVHTETVLCARDDDRPVIPNTELCLACHQLLPVNLRYLADAWDALEASVTRSTDYTLTERVGGTKSRDNGNIWNPRVASLLADLADWTGYLLRILSKEAPREADTHLELIDTLAHQIDEHHHRQTGLALAVMGHYHSRFFTRYPYVGTFILNDSSHYKRRTIGALNSRGVRTVALQDMRCTEEVGEAQFGEHPLLCGGQLVVTFDDDQAPSQVLCRNQPRHRVPATDWMHVLGSRTA